VVHVVQKLGSFEVKTVQKNPTESITESISSIYKSQTFSGGGLCPSLRPFPRLLPTHGCSAASPHISKRLCTYRYVSKTHKYH